MMRFEARDITNYAEPLLANELKEGEIYFWVEFYDDGHLLVPALKPWVFVGRNLKPGDTRHLYFEDITALEDTRDRFILEEGQGGVYDYEHALNLLLACSLRRRAAGMK